MAWQRGRTFLKLAVAAAFEHTGASRALSHIDRALVRSVRTWTGGEGGGVRVHVLGFHRVVDDLDRLPPGVIRSLCISTGSLDRLLDIARSRFDVVPLEHAAEVIAGRAQAARDLLVVTFDDGYRDVYLRARPVLARHRVAATVFVPTGYIDSRTPLPHDRLHALLVRAERLGRRLEGGSGPQLLARDLALADSLVAARGAASAVEKLIEELPAERLASLAEALADRLGTAAALDDGSYVMDAEELRACARSGIDLGSHTVDHVALLRESPARVRRELEQPRRDLEAIAGRPCRTFAYCNGLWTAALVEAVRAAGYSAAVTTADRVNGPGDDHFLLGRKVMWEGHVRALGRFSRALGAAQLHDLFGRFGGAMPVDAGRREPERERLPRELWA